MGRRKSGASGGIGRRTTLKMWRPLVVRVRVSPCPLALAAGKALIRWLEIFESQAGTANAYEY